MASQPRDPAFPLPMGLHALWFIRQRRA